MTTLQRSVIKASKPYIWPRRSTRICNQLSGAAIDSATFSTLPTSAYSSYANPRLRRHALFLHEAPNLSSAGRFRDISSNSSSFSTSAHSHHHAMPSFVRIVEVGPRDGLQNEKQSVSVDTKVTLIDKLAAAGLKSIEAGSFVSKKWVPQMANSQEVIERVLATHTAQPMNFSALTPNTQGLDAALKCGIKEVAVFGAASQAFSQKNINCSIEDSLVRFEAVARKALDSGLHVRGYVSCVLGCPYEGQVDPEKVIYVSEKLLAMGCYEVSLGDTIGVGTAGSTDRLLSKLLKKIPVEKVAVHFHDTYGQALANIHVALQHGVSVVDSSISGLGGCPYARGASGNVATEDVVYMLDGLGIKHGLNMEKLIEAGNYIDEQLGGRMSGSKVSRAKCGKA